MKQSMWFVGVLWVVLGLSACSSHDEHYYRLHPKALQSAMAGCPSHAVGALSCDQLKTLAVRVNQLAMMLKHDQLGYGKKIIKLQEERDQLMKQMNDHPEQVELKYAWVDSEQRLAEHLAVVKWLASPEG